MKTLIPHTPAPWRVEYDNDTPVVTFEARDVCRVEARFGDGEGNAELIAAAPDLLAACVKADENIRYLCGMVNKYQAPLGRGPTVRADDWTEQTSAVIEQLTPKPKPETDE